MKKDFSKIHPQLQQSAKMFPNLTYSKLNVWLINLLSRFMPASKPPQDVSIENVFITGKHDKQKIRLRIYKPKSSNEAMPVLLWIHGGGYILGSPEQDDVSCIQYARELGITVVSVDYRLAPKYPFPAGLEDCYSALKWIVSHAQQLGIDDKRIAVGGGSAGAGLAASLVQYANDQNEIKIIFQLLVYPMLDDRTVLRTDIDDSNNITWNQKSNKFGWESYLGKKCGDENMPEYSVPARRKNLSGLPTTWIGVGTLDIFYDEDMAYAQRLKEAGVECEMCVVSGAFHGFDVFDPQIPVVQEFRKSQITALKNTFFGN
ncbi:MAG TPA: alpha/beta hydrolase [Anaerolineae bacterium]|mgnify:FL=1|nr:alpha/beta hydrolase [Anaerolineae bacterium]